MSEGIRYNKDDNKPGAILGSNNKDWSTSVAGFKSNAELEKKTIYFNDDVFDFTNRALSGKVKDNDQIKYMVKDDNVDYSNSDDLIVNLKDDLKNNNNRIYLANSFTDIIDRKSTDNVYYSNMLLNLNKGVYSNYVSTPNYNKDVYDYIDKLKSKNINVPIDKVAYYKNNGGIERVYLNNGYVISLDKNENINAYDYVYNTKYLLKKDKENTYDLTSIKICNKNTEVLEINYDGKMTTVKDLLKENKDEQNVYSISDRGKLDSISLKDDSISFSDGYTLEKIEDGYKSVDRISMVTEVAKSRLGNGSPFHDNTDWCAAFVNNLFNDTLGEGYLNHSGYGAGHSLLYGMEGTWIDVNNLSIDGSYPDQIVYVNSNEKDKDSNGFIKLTDEIIDDNVSNKEKIMPREGDLIFFNPDFGDEENIKYPLNMQQGYQNEDRYYSRHVGYVWKVENGKVYTIEGNGKNYYVSEYEYDLLNDDSINGYFRPNY